MALLPHVKFKCVVVVEHKREALKKVSGFNIGPGMSVRIAQKHRRGTIQCSSGRESGSCAGAGSGQPVQ